MSGRLAARAVTRDASCERADRLAVINFGGPGAPVADAIEAQGSELFAALNERFDIVGFDPRGTGGSGPVIDCKVDQETQGLYARPFFTPETLDTGALLRRSKAYADRCRQLNADVLRYASTGNTARNMETLRRLLGEKQISFLGYSWPRSSARRTLGDLDAQTPGSSARWAASSRRAPPTRSPAPASAARTRGSPMTSC